MPAPSVTQLLQLFAPLEGVEAEDLTNWSRATLGRLTKSDEGRPSPALGKSIQSVSAAIHDSEVRKLLVEVAWQYRKPFEQRPAVAKALAAGLEPWACAAVALHGPWKPEIAWAFARFDAPDYGDAAEHLHAYQEHLTPSAALDDEETDLWESLVSPKPTKRRASAADPAPWNLRARRQWTLAGAGKTKKGFPPRPSRSCTCRGGPRALLQLNLRELSPKLPRRLLRIWWCAKCWSADGAPVDSDVVQVLRRFPAGEESRTAGGLRLALSPERRVYPAATIARELVDEERYHGEEYQAFLDASPEPAEGQVIGRVGGYPSMPQSSFLAEQLNQRGRDGTCACCKRPVDLSILILEGSAPGLDLGGDSGSLLIATCRTDSCARPELSTDYSCF